MQFFLVKVNSQKNGFHWISKKRPIIQEETKIQEYATQPMILKLELSLTLVVEDDDDHHCCDNLYCGK